MYGIRKFSLEHISKKEKYLLIFGRKEICKFISGLGLDRSKPERLVKFKRYCSRSCSQELLQCFIYVIL